jgi:hypothetical protein
MVTLSIRLIIYPADGRDNWLSALVDRGIGVKTSHCVFHGQVFYEVL